MPFVKTPTCHLCGKSDSLELTDAEVAGMERTRFIQDALPNRSVDFREMLISGTHPACWDAIFPPEEDEEDFGQDLPAF